MNRSHAGAAAAAGRAAGPARILLGIAGAFLLLGFLVREDYGSTWDEAESYQAGRRNLEIAAAVFSGDAATVEWPWHELPGHQLVLDSARAAFARAVTGWLPPSPAPVGERLFNLGLTSAALVLTGAIAFELTGSVALAALAASALALQPKLLAHAQNNPKDLPGLFVFTLATLALVRVRRRARPRRLAIAATTLGLAISTSLPSIALVPFAAALLLATPGDRWPARLRRLAVVLGGGALVALASWPWLWPDPLGRLLQIAGRVAEFPTGFEVLYFGRLYPSNALPWHYTLGSLLVATPLVLALFATVGATAVLGDAGRPGSRERRLLAAIALGWIALLLALDALATFHYDGVRHVLAVLPALALLAALGVERAHAAGTPLLRRVTSARTAAGVAAFALALPVGALAADLVRLHPYEDAYLGLPFRRLRPGAGESQFEIEYWGSSYRELAQWLDREAEPGATIVAPIASHCLEPYLRSDLVVRERLRPRVAAELAHRPFVVFIARQAWYEELGLDEVVASGPPLHAVRTSMGTLAVVYRPDRLPSELGRPGGPRSLAPAVKAAVSRRPRVQ